MSLLNGFKLTQGDQLLDLPLTAQRLLAYLALNERPVLRSRAAGTLYLEKSEERACGNLRSALWRARQPGADLVHVQGNYLSLANSVSVDTCDAVIHARRLASDAEVDESELDESPLLGDLLPEWYDDWILTERERLRQLRLHGLEALSLRLTAKGMLARAIDVALLVTTAEPLRESAHRALLEAHLAEGNLAEAIRQYEKYAADLKVELGIEPSDQMRALLKSVPKSYRSSFASGHQPADWPGREATDR